jgi:hypothetical protein
MEKKRQRISALMGALMLTVAGVFAFMHFIFGLIPVVGNAVDFVLSLIDGTIMTIWFIICGASFMRGKALMKFFAFFGPMLIELFGDFIPEVAAITEGILIGTLLTILVVRAEDREYNKKRSPA